MHKQEVTPSLGWHHPQVFLSNFVSALLKRLHMQEVAVWLFSMTQVSEIREKNNSVGDMEASVHDRHTQNTCKSLNNGDFNFTSKWLTIVQIRCWKQEKPMESVWSCLWMYFVNPNLFWALNVFEYRSMVYLCVSAAMQHKVSRWWLSCLSI